MIPCASFLVCECVLFVVNKRPGENKKYAYLIDGKLVNRRSTVASTLGCTAQCARPPSYDGSSKQRRHSSKLTSRPSIVHVWTLCLIVTIQEPICTFFFFLTRRTFKIVAVSIRSTQTVLKDRRKSSFHGL